jgi:hypothetical protein
MKSVSKTIFSVWLVLMLTFFMISCSDKIETDGSDSLENTETAERSTDEQEGSESRDSDKVVQSSTEADSDNPTEGESKESEVATESETETEQDHVIHLPMDWF